MRKIGNNNGRCGVNRIFKIAFVALLSVSVAFGQTFGNYLQIGYAEPPRAEISTVYVDAGSNGAKDYANDVAGRLAQRLSEQGLNGRITVQSGFGCDAAVCVTVSYTVDGYTFNQEVHISDTMIPGNGPPARVQNVSQPRDPSSNDPSQDAKNALADAQRSYDNAVRDEGNARDQLRESRRKLDDANGRLSGVAGEVKTGEAQLNSAINQANRAQNDATEAGRKALNAAQNASDRKTEFDRLADYKPKLEGQRSQLENDLKSLENEVNQAAANTKTSTEGTVNKQKSNANSIADATRTRQNSEVASHNKAAASLSNSIALDKDLGDLKPDVPIADASQFKTSPDTIGGEKLKKAAFELDTAKQTLETLTPMQKEPGTRILPEVQSALYNADNAYAKGDIDRGDFAIRAAGALMEMAIGIAPLAVFLAAPEAAVFLTASVAGALALDLYQSSTGKHILTGEPLTNFERGLSYFGVAVAIIPFGDSVKAGMQGITKALQLGEEYILASKSAQQATEFVEVAANAQRFAKDSEIIASSIEEVREFGTVLEKFKLQPPEWPSGMSFNKDLKVHMSSLDGFTQQTGVKGCHNLVNFENTVAEKGLKVLSKEIRDIDGIYQIKYQIPKLDVKGNPIPGEFKAQEFLKTVYDPKVYSDSEILRLAQIAAAQSPEYSVVGRKIIEAKVVGFNFAVYLQDGVVINVHPI